MLAAVFSDSVERSLREPTSTQMLKRSVVNTAAFACVLGAVALAAQGMAKDVTHKARVVETQDALRAIRQQVILHAETPSSGVIVWPERIDPGWFDGKLPRNAVITDQRPWLEIEKISGRAHPSGIEAISSKTASFWYNPSNGVVRARVPSMNSAPSARKLYESINAE